MTDKLTIDVTPEELQRIEELARQRGFTAPADYLKALVELDAEDDEEDPEASLRQALHEVKTGQTFPISTL